MRLVTVIAGLLIVSSTLFAGSESECSIAFSECLAQAQDGADKKQCAMEKIECQGPTTYDPSRKGSKSGSSGVRG